MNNLKIIFVLFVTQSLTAQPQPLPEHPRPDHFRSWWINLNGLWSFEFDASDKGNQESWYAGKKTFSKTINVPFPWGSPLSQVQDEADLGWYMKDIVVPSAWAGKRIFLIIGASDWATDIWLDGHPVGRHEGGYMPFEVDVSKYAKTGNTHRLIIRVDDKRRMFTLYGKQGYGNARGIWQTVYLEARENLFIEHVHCTPDVDHQKVDVLVKVNEALSISTPIKLKINSPNGEVVVIDSLRPSQKEKTISVPLVQPRLWSLNDPYLYDVIAIVGKDSLSTYFGYRKISVEKLPGTSIPYISLNGEPIYLQLTLDQSYHPDGYYTFPSDAFMKNEILLAKSIGLNGIRTHIKPDLPRKLYWADRLGILVMADLPNSWGEPDAAMQKESETTLREMINRDYNHPSIFSWIVFNETWGLTTKIIKESKEQSEYLPKTQHWVASMYYLTKSLDPTRLVEDNSICCGRGHTETDIYSWHEYQPGWAWDDVLANIVKNNYAGSTFHYEKGFQQANQPNINSECGNVWGYEGSTGDVDWSYDYHRMINSFRRFPQVAGWLYTEHHDVINEWNGYWRFDRSNKYTGLEDLVEGMSINDLHSKDYISTGNEITRDVKAGEMVDVPLFLSRYGPGPKDQLLTLNYSLIHTDGTGESRPLVTNKMVFKCHPWDQIALPPLKLTMAPTNGLTILKLFLLSPNGDTLNRNFMHFVVHEGQQPDNASINSTAVAAFKSNTWTLKQWNVLNDLKVNGAGKGYFEYELHSPQVDKNKKIKESYIVLEVSAKQLFDKDKASGFDQNQNYMLGSRVSPSSNPNSYPMTDESRTPSALKVSVNGKLVLTQSLADDPADHKGVLSWHAQLKDKKLREAGSYGYLIKIPVSSGLLKAKNITLKLESVDGGGLALYGSKFGRYPVDINWVVKYK